MSELTSTPGAALPANGTKLLAAELTRVWPDHDRAIGGSVLGLAGLAGLAGAVLLVGSPPGLGVLLTGLAVGAATLPTTRQRLGVHVISFAALSVLLLAGVVVRDSPWFVALCLLGATAVASYALAPGRTLFGSLMGGASLPLAALRCLPWLRRGLQPRATNLAVTWRPALRIIGLTGVLLLVFGSLFAAADAAFASLIPQPDLGLLPARLAVAVAVSGVAASAAFLGAVPPRWDVLAPARARPVSVAEWVVPIAVLNALFLTFVTVQLTVLFGGHRHVLATAGLTYAEYARGGFGQLLVVTLLTLSVVAATVRWAPRGTHAQRTALRLLLGMLCTLTLVIVASALHRLHLYEEAFGFTRLRLFMNAFETWLGGLVVLVLVAGIRLRATWLARAVVATAAVTLLALGAVNPDGFVAQRNVDRYLATGKLDIAYLQELSADAVPAVDRLPEPTRSCVLAGMAHADEPAGSPLGLGGWNLGRARASRLLAARPVLAPATCPAA
jgi:two-component system, OmpR family, sensor histidine kinase BaeS